MEKNLKPAPGEGQERIITIADLLREILRRLPFVIAAAVVFAVLFGAYKYLQDKQTAALSASPIEEAAENTLTQEEQEEVNNVLKIIENMEEQQEYVENSILLQINAFDESKATLRYTISLDADAAESTESDLQAFIDAYQTYISSGALSEALEEEGIDLEVQYITELISFETAYEEEDSTGSDRSTAFLVTVIHADQESCEELAGAAAQCLSDYAQVLNSRIGAHSLELTEYICTEVVDTDLRTYKLDRVNSIVTMQSTIETLEAELTSEQTQILEMQLEGESEDQTAADESSESVVSVSISKKYLLLGAAVGFLLACLYIIFSYIMRGTINASKDLRYLYGVRVLGELHADGKRNPFVRIGNLLIGRQEVYLTPEEEQELLFSNIRVFCERNGADRVLLLFGTAKLPREWAQALCEKLNCAGIQAECAENPVFSAQALERLAEYDTVVLAEQVRASRYEVLEKEIGLCAGSGVEIAGAVVLV